ncbi:MAG: hypothetical protein WBG46_10650 [Nonlabens sp.]
MNDLIQLIQFLSDDEVGGFLAFAKARTKRTDTKNIDLFHLLKAGVRTGLDEKIYGKTNKNALYALKNRLKQSLVDFIAIHAFENGHKVQMTTLRLLLASRVLLENGSYKLGFATLSKTEQLCGEADLFTVRHEVYLTWLEYSHHSKKLDIEAISERFLYNKKLMAQSDQISLLFAKHKNLPATAYDLSKYRESTKVIKIDASLGFKSLLELLELYTDAASQAGSYQLIINEINAIETVFNQKSRPKYDSTHYRDVKILIAFSRYRLLEFKQAKSYLHELLNEVDERSTSYLRLIIIDALCECFTGHLDEALDLLSKIKNPQMDAQCVRAMCYLLKNEPQQSLRHLNKLRHTDAYYSKSYTQSIIIKKNLLLLLIYIDLGNVNLIESQHRRLQKDFKSIKKHEEQRIVQFIKLALSIYNNPDSGMNESIKEQVDQLVLSNNPEDVFAITFYAWLRARASQSDFYGILLGLVRS